MNAIIGDAQTAVTSLGGAIAGSASDKIANVLIGYAGLGVGMGGLGDAGLRFIIRAAVSSVTFSAAVSVMPETADNVFFSIIYFAGNKQLISDAVRFADIVVRGTSSLTSLKKPVKAMASGSHCACGGSSASSCSC